MFTLRVCYNMDSGCTLTNLEIEPVMLASVLLLLVNGKTNRRRVTEINLTSE